MPLHLARLRHVLGRLVAAGGAGNRPRGGGSGAQTVLVPLTVRATTRDGADIRLLLDARFSSPSLGDGEVERIAVALLVPAAAREVRRSVLRALEHSPSSVLSPALQVVRPQAAALGVELHALEVVAAEHLLASPSAPDDGVEHHGSR